jgi:hypothetical protein
VETARIKTQQHTQEALAVVEEKDLDDVDNKKELVLFLYTNHHNKTNGTTTLQTKKNSGYT